MTTMANNAVSQIGKAGSARALNGNRAQNCVIAVEQSSAKSAAQAITAASGIHKSETSSAATAKYMPARISGTTTRLASVASRGNSP